MRETRLSGSEGGGILSDSPYPYSDWADSTFNHNNTGFALTGLHATSVQCAHCHSTAAGGYNLPAPVTSCGEQFCHQSDYNATNNPCIPLPALLSVSQTVRTATPPRPRTQRPPGATPRIGR